MRKAVLISIRPEWCEKIMSGQKTIEVRKTRPKMNPPFKCYIYKCGNGKVIGEFLCDEIININGARRIPSDIARPTCLEPAKLHQYLGAAVGYGWHISDLKIYDQPKELNEFWFPPELYCEKERCGGCPYDQVPDVNGEYSFDCEWKRPLMRPPQSWRYVEEELWND